jgi:N-methylhydantoinase A/oxoprolinase/acetone carboxylase beta subunit
MNHPIGIISLFARPRSDTTGPVMNRVDHTVPDTTVATNIMLEMKGPSLATSGHGGTVDVRRNCKEVDFDVRLQPSHPIPSAGGATR